MKITTDLCLIKNQVIQGVHLPENIMKTAKKVRFKLLFLDICSDEATQDRFFVAIK